MNSFKKAFQNLLNSRLIKDSFWALAGNVIGKGLALIAGILIARLLDAKVFGEYSIVRNTLLSMAMFSTFGIGYTGTKYTADLKKNQPHLLLHFVKAAMKITFWFCLVMAVFLFLFSDQIAIQILDAPHLAFAMKVLAILIIFNGLTTTQVGVLAGFGEFRSLARINSFIGVLTFFLSVTLTYLYGFNGALVALLSVQVINWFLNYRLLQQKLKTYTTYKTKVNSFLKVVLKFSAPVALQEMTYAITAWLGTLLLIKYASYEDLGKYNAAMQWNAIVLFIPGILRNVTLSHLSEKVNNHEQHSSIMKTTIVINFVMTFLPALIIFFMSDYISKLYGYSFVGLGKLITIALFTTIFISISNVYTQVYMSKGLNWVMFLIRLFRDFGILILAYILIRINFASFGPPLLLIYSSLLINILFLILIITLYNKKFKNALF